MSLGPLYVFLGEVSVQVLCPFFNWVVCLPGVESCEFFICFGDQALVWGIIGKYVFPYCWFSLYFNAIFFSPPETFYIDEVPFVYSFLYVPCFRGRVCEDVAVWNVWDLPANVFLKLKSSLKGKRVHTVDEIQENMLGQLKAIGRIVWGSRVPTLKRTESSLSSVQYFLYLVSSSIKVSVIVCGWILSGQTSYIFNLSLERTMHVIGLYSVLMFH